MARIRIAREMIDFQHDNTGKQLETIFAEIIEFVQKKSEELQDKPDEHPVVLVSIMSRTGFAKTLSDYVMSRFGIRLSIEWADSFNSPTIAVPQFNTQNIFSMNREEWSEEELEAAAKNIERYFKDTAGSVDLKRAKVSGWFSNLTGILVLNPYDLFIKTAATPAEMTAVFLHEVGHLFNHFEYSDRLSTTNQIMANLATTIRTDDKPEKREYWIRELARHMKEPTDSFEELVNEKNRTILAYQLFQKYIQNIDSQLSDKKYDETSDEQMADNFAARFGYSKNLASFLDKRRKSWYVPKGCELVLKDGNDFNLSTFVTKMTLCGLIGYFIKQVLSIYMAYFKISGMGVKVMVLGKFMAYLSILRVFVYGVFKVGMVHVVMPVLNGGINGGFMSYDEDTARYKRLREQCIDVLKDPALPKPIVMSTIENIKGIDALIKDVKLHETTINKISNLLIKANRNSKQAIMQQRIIEELAHNDLFLKSAELKTLHQ